MVDGAKYGRAVDLSTDAQGAKSSAEFEERPSDLHHMLILVGKLYSYPGS